MKTIAIIGCGNLGISIAEGILNDGFLDAENIFATRNRIERIQHLADKNVQVGTNNSEAAQKADVIILGVKPYKIKEILTEIKPQLNPDKVIISLATGISLAEIQTFVGNEIPILRAMPNTAAAVETSMTCICGLNYNDNQLNFVKSIFDHIGKSIVIREDLMDAATVIGACGIAYVLRFIRAMIQGGIEIGFDANTATQIVTQTVSGAAELLIENGKHPEEEIDKVTTPKGCTIAGLNEMEHQGFSSALIKGIQTSYERI